jgi:hypothetical protein
MSDMREEYAGELTKRFDQFKSWAIANWPASASPLTATDFGAADREMRLLLGAKLQTADQAGISANDDNAQYMPVTAMPWP